MPRWTTISTVGAEWTGIIPTQNGWTGTSPIQADWMDWKPFPSYNLQQFAKYSFTYVRQTGIFLPMNAMQSSMCNS